MHRSLTSTTHTAKVFILFSGLVLLTLVGCTKQTPEQRAQKFHNKITALCTQVATDYTQENQLLGAENKVSDKAKDRLITFVGDRGSQKSKHTPLHAYESKMNRVINQLKYFQRTIRNDQKIQPLLQAEFNKVLDAINMLERIQKLVINNKEYREEARYIDLMAQTPVVVQHHYWWV